MDLFSNEPIQLLPFDGEVFLYRQFLGFEESASYYQYFSKKLEWKQDHITLFSKQHLVPRLQCWYAENGESYQYSGIQLQPRPLEEKLLELKKRIEREVQSDFNSVLCNWYRSGKDYVAFHSDDEPELGREPIIASLSLGGTRVFRFKNKLDSKIKVDIELESGDLVLMKGLSQSHWQHSVIKTQKEVAGRINFTFRKIRNFV